MAYDQELVKGTESYLIEVLMRSSTDGQPLTGLAVGDVAVKYQRDGAAAAVDLGSPAVLTTLGTWETDAWKETAITGLYQYGVPNACLVTGATGVTLVFTGTGAIASKYRIRLTGTNSQDAVHGGMSALPNAAADAAGGLAISDAGGLDLDGVLSGNTPQTGDGYVRLGAPAGASIAADIAATKAAAGGTVFG